jgi:hypothetical protein
MAATAINSRDIRFEPGEAQTFALRFVTGKKVSGNYGPRMLFTTTDERKIWLDAEEGQELERELAKLNVLAEDQVRVTKIRRRGGFSWDVEPVKTAREATPVTPQAQEKRSSTDSNLSPAAARMCAAFLVAIDAIAEAQACADRRGLKITFTSEDVRATAISAYIGGGR